MKKVIFICIVSLTVCFVAGNSVPVSSSSTTSSLPPPTIKDSKAESITQKNSVPDTHEATNISPSSPATNASPGHSPTEVIVPTKGKSDSPTTIKPAPETTTKNATSEASSSTTTTTTTTTTTPATPAAGKKNETLTSTTPKTEASTKAAEPEPKLARGFDGPSFIGGIILTLGLLAIGFMGFKYYKNQTERNYHTL